MNRRDFLKKLPKSPRIDKTTDQTAMEVGSGGNCNSDPMRHFVKIRGEWRQVNLDDADAAYLSLPDYKTQTAVIARRREAAEKELETFVPHPASVSERLVADSQDETRKPDPEFSIPADLPIDASAWRYLSVRGFSEEDVASRLGEPGRRVLNDALSFRTFLSQQAPAVDKAELPPASRETDWAYLEDLRGRAYAGSSKDREAYIKAVLARSK